MHRALNDGSFSKTLEVDRFQNHSSLINKAHPSPGLPRHTLYWGKSYVKHIWHYNNNYYRIRQQRRIYVGDLLPNGMSRRPLFRQSLFRQYFRLPTWEHGTEYCFPREHFPFYVYFPLALMPPI